MSGKEVRKLKTLRSKLAILCPDTDGLQEKHRIKFVPEGETPEERLQNILDIESELVLPGVAKGHKGATQKISHLISLIYSIEGFTMKEIYRLFSNQRYKNRNS